MKYTFVLALLLACILAVHASSMTATRKHSLRQHKIDAAELKHNALKHNHANTDPTEKDENGTGNDTEVPTDTTKNPDETDLNGTDETGDQQDSQKQTLEGEGSDLQLGDSEKTSEGGNNQVPEDETEKNSDVGGDDGLVDQQNPDNGEKPVDTTDEVGEKGDQIVDPELSQE